MLATGDEDAIARAVDVLGERTPPVVVIAAALAAPERVGVAVLEQALEVIAPDEEREARAELAAMRAPAAAHVRVAVPEVVEEFDDEEPEANARRMRKVN